jgi:hypothetical protein
VQLQHDHQHLRRREFREALDITALNIGHFESAPFRDRHRPGHRRAVGDPGRRACIPWRSGRPRTRSPSSPMTDPA